MHDERYHYTECGLDDVFLLNGFEWNVSPRGKTIAIKEIDALNRAIGEHLSRHKKELGGKEMRYLRREMLMSQATLAHLLKVSEQTIHRWETEKSASQGRRKLWSECSIWSTAVLRRKRSEIP